MKDKIEDYNSFVNQIELPIKRVEKRMNESSDYKTKDSLFWEKISIGAAIHRTTRLVTENPNHAKQYLESLPKATMD